MVDLVYLTAIAGDGGNGRVSFRREKFIPKGGPDGGNGGRGGSVIIRANKHMSTLQHFSGVKTIQAQFGRNGAGRNQSGADGDDTVIEVPPGTTVWLLAENEMAHVRRMRRRYEGHTKHAVHLQKFYLEKEGQAPPRRPLDDVRWLKEWEERHAGSTTQVGDGQMSDRVGDKDGDLDAGTTRADESFVMRSDDHQNLDFRQVKKLELLHLAQDGDEYVLCQGGLGGRGNDAFKGPELTTPLEAEYGSLGERAVIALELKLLADVGLVGLPNAGKSTFLSIMTKAHPKIAAYPFTTLEPQLGLLHREYRSGGSRDLVVADIPGLIEGAHEGKGLGFAFLRHIEACRVLVYLLALPEETIFDTELSDTDKARQLVAQYYLLHNELLAYKAEIVEKPSLIVLNKSDLYSEELLMQADKAFAAVSGSLKLLHMSTLTRQGVEEVMAQIFAIFEAGDKD